MPGFAIAASPCAAVSLYAVAFTDSVVCCSAGMAVVGAGAAVGADLRALPRRGGSTPAACCAIFTAGVASPVAIGAGGVAAGELAGTGWMNDSAHVSKSSAKYRWR